MIKKHILSIVAVLVMGLTPVVTTAPAYAATLSGQPSNTQTNFLSTLVQAVSQKFGIDESQLQSFINTFVSQHRQEMQQKLQTNEKNHLESLVSQGKITSSQEQQILAEQAKLQSEYNPATFKNLTPDERKSQFQKEQAEIKAWSESTGIDAKYLRPGFGMRMHMFNRWNNNAVPTVTPTPGA